MKFTFLYGFIRVRRALQRYFSQHPFDFLPIRHAHSDYNTTKLLHDLRAGLNVSAMAFAQGMACALIAGLPISFGIYCAVIAPIVGAIFSGSKNTVLGPTNATAVLVLSAFLSLPPQTDRVAMAGLLVLLVGVFQVVGAFLQVASLTQYISRSVVVGYVTAASLLIMANQFHHALGVKLEGADTFFDLCAGTIQKLSEVHLPSLAISLLTGWVYLVMSRRIKSIPSAAIVLVLMALVAEGMKGVGYDVLRLTSIHLSEWHIGFPAMGFDGIRLMTSSALAIAFLALMENTFMAKSLANRTGQRVEVHQEMFGLGLANVASAVCGGMPASGSLTRSALNWKSGAATACAGLFSGVFCLIAVAIFGAGIRYIPVASLAVIVIIVACTVIDRHVIQVTLKSTHSDAAVFLTTFGFALLTPLDFAIFMGVAISVVLFLRKASSPHLIEYTFNESGNLCEVEAGRPRENPQISIIHVEGELFFGAADLFRDEIRRVCRDASLKVVVLRLKNARHLDATSVLALEELIQYLRETGRELVVSGATREIYHVLRKSGLILLLKKENFFRASPRNPNVSTRRALLRAKELVGGSSAEIRIFYDPAKKPGE